MVLLRGSSRRVLQGTRSRRKTSWEVGPGGTGATAISASGTGLVGAAVVPTVPGLTVVRTRGELLLTLITATGALDGFRGAFGIGIATFAAVNAGIGSVPVPIADEDQEIWLYHRFFSIVGNISTEADFGISTVLRLEIDSKAMRKLDDGLSLYGAFEVVETGAAVMDMSFNSRLLVKLP